MVGFAIQEFSVSLHKVRRGGGGGGNGFSVLNK
jgi:hypothetical protein